MLSVFWRQWLDSESVLYQGSTIRGPLDAHELPVLTRNKENQRYRCLRAVLLQQSLCFLAVVDCSQGQIHGSEGKFPVIPLLPSCQSCQPKPALRLPWLHVLDDELPFRFSATLSSCDL